MSFDGLVPFTRGVWVSTEPVQFLRMRLTATMAVFRLNDNELLLYSPVAITRNRRAAIEGLGAVAHLYAPNLFHHTWVGEWASAFPSARVHAPARLANKRPDLRIDRVHSSSPEPAFANIVDELPIDGFRLDECALFHRPSRTLVVADLLHNVGRPQHRWTKLYTRTMGFYDRIALSRVIRWTGFRDKVAGRRSLDRLLQLPFDRLIVGHGKPITVGARAALSAAYSWLEVAQPSGS